MGGLQPRRATPGERNTPQLRGAPLQAAEVPASPLTTLF